LAPVDSVGVTWYGATSYDAMDVYFTSATGEEQALSWVTGDASSPPAVEDGYGVVQSSGAGQFGVLDFTRLAGWDKPSGTLDVRVVIDDNGTPETWTSSYTVDPVLPVPYNSAHVDTGLGRLLEQFKGSVRFRALLSSYVDGVQDFEDVAYQIINARRLDNAAGYQLDGLGQIVNVLRGGRSDTDYRLRIRAELAIILSQGTTEDLIGVLRLLLGLASPPDIQIDEYYPKAIFMRPRNFIVNDDPATIAALLRRAVSAATNLQFVYSQTENDDDDLFRFSDFSDVAISIDTYAYRTGITGADEEIRFNGGEVIANTTTCWLGKSDQSQTSHETEIENLAIGDWIRFTKTDNEYAEVQLTGTPTDNTTFYIITVTNGRASPGFTFPPDDTNGTVFLIDDFEASSSHGYSNGTYTGAK